MRCNSPEISYSVKSPPSNAPMTLFPSTPAREGLDPSKVPRNEGIANKMQMSIKVWMKRANGTNVAHQFLLPAPSDSNATRSLSTTKDASSFFHSGIRLGFSSQNRASGSRVANFNIGMAKSLPFCVQQDMNTFNSLLQPFGNLERCNVLVILIFSML